ncbi:TPA: hypothetical protein N0F65_001183 [Lagenidium giganteum]|uniref:tRNA wybutosine-synthesizing protein 3 n=1 Tax=Lagenidium giganteum TaxID=4803 RepID=A0AAV2Z217_9STRA|nr:TPA: hypothetical protein N0F65_001183 [Lagenidium giganteum]
MSFDQLKRESLRKLREVEDKSPKGSVDAPIVDLINAINSHPNYVTSSSCSGRIAVFCATSASVPASTATGNNEDAASGHLITKGGKWLLAEHGTVTLAMLKDALQTGQSQENSNMLIFKHEPFIMHVVCRDAAAAKELLQWGIACGFRESGIVLGNKKVMCAIRTTANMMEIPLGTSPSQLMVNDAYLDWIVTIANEKFIANQTKTDHLFAAFRKTFGASVDATADAALEPSFRWSPLELECQCVGHTTVHQGDKIIVFGGQACESAGGTTSRSADVVVFSVSPEGAVTYQQVLSPSSGEWPAARMYHSAVMVGNEMIVFGGRAGPARPMNDVFALNLTTMVWRRVAITNADVGPSPRWGHSCSTVNSTIYVYGGRDETSVCNDLFALDLAAASPTWKRIDSPSAPSAGRFDHIGVAVGKDKLFFWGGMTTLTVGGLENVAAPPTVFDTTRMQWEKHASKDVSLAQPVRYGGAACVVDDRYVVVIGGIPCIADAPTTSESTQSVLVWDIEDRKSQWRQLGTVAHENASFVHHTATWVPSARSVLALGGGFQCFGFGQFYSRAFAIGLPLQSAAPAPSAAVVGTQHSSNAAVPATAAKHMASSIPADQPLGVLVEKHNVKAVKTLLEGAKVYDKTRRVHVVPNVQLPEGSGNSAFLLPVSAAIHDAMQEHPQLASLSVVVDDEVCKNKFGKGFSKNDVIRGIVLDFAGRHHVPAAVIKAEVPERFEFLSDVLMVPREAFTSSAWQAFARDMWAAVCAATTPPCSRVARKAFIDAGEKRQSHVELLYSNAALVAALRSPGWVDVLENGITYGFDVTKVMFSSGNVTEKARMGRIVSRNEIIVDLFCGIGYYVLPFLVHGGAAHVHACEWNPDSVDALRYNLVRNHVDDRCTVHVGDNQVNAPKLGSIADRVNLGLLPTSEKAWPLAINALKPTGGWMHVHDNVATEDRERWENHVVTSMKALAVQAGRHWKIECVHVERVKSYAPKVYHLVADVYCTPV